MRLGFAPCLSYALAKLEEPNGDAKVVLLRGCCDHGDRGPGGNSPVCKRDENLEIALETDLLYGDGSVSKYSHVRCKQEARHRWLAPGLFYTSVAAFDFCREKALKVARAKVLARAAQMLRMRRSEGLRQTAL